jgi:hypothetical protein
VESASSSTGPFFSPAWPLLKRRHVVAFTPHTVSSDNLVAVKAYRTSVDHFDARVQLLGVGAGVALLVLLQFAAVST